MQTKRVRHCSSWITGAACRVFVTGVALMAAFAVVGCEKKQAVAPPPPVVEVVTVTARDVPIYQEWVGALDGNVNAVIKPQVTGYLIKQNYTRGATGQEGAGPLRDRSPDLPGRRGPGQGVSGPGQGDLAGPRPTM